VSPRRHLIGHYAPVPDDQGVDSAVGIRTDLRSSARRIASTPELLVATFAVFGIATTLDIASRLQHGSGRPIFNVAFALWELVLLGFAGTERVWFQRYLGLAEVIALTRRYVWRFSKLALLALIPYFILAVSVSVLWAIVGKTAPAQDHWAPPVLFYYLLFLDGLLTFVVPALVETTKKPFEALRIGQQMIKNTWPGCAWYVILPGMTLASLAGLLPARSSIVAIIGTSIIGPFLALWFRGAILAFYLRHAPQPSEDDVMP